MIRYNERDYTPDRLPSSLPEVQAHGMSWPKNRDVYIRAGAREVVPFDVPAGYGVVAGTLTETDDGEFLTQHYEIRTVAEQQEIDTAARKNEMAAKLTPALVGLAAAYRDTLRAMFGANAEVNREVTQDAVLADMLQLPPEQYDAKTADLLKLAFEQLSAITGDGTTWTFFETVGDLIPGGA